MSRKKSLFSSIKARVNILFSSLVFITAFIVLSFFWLENKKEQINSFLSDTKQVNLGITKLRNIEKDVIIYETINPDFYKSDTANFLKERKKFSSQVRTDIQNLTEYKELSGSGIIESLPELKQLVSEYEIAFDSLVFLLKKRGWKDFGKVGQMREAIHHIESSDFDKDMTLLLMLRRHEKDYLLRKQEKYIRKLESTADSFRASIKNTGGNPKSRQELLSDLVNYRENFAEIVELEKKIGNKAGKGVNGKIDRITEKITDNLSTLNIKTKQLADDLSIRIQNIFIGILIIAAALNILVIFILRKKLAVPLNKLSDSIHHVIKSNFNPKLKIKEFKSKDEISDIASDVAFMLKKVHQKNEQITAQSEEIKKSYKNLNLLSKIGRKVTSKLSVKGILIVAYKYVSKLVATDVFAVGIYNEQKMGLDFYGFHHETEAFELGFDPLDNENMFSAYCFNKQKKVFINDVEKEYKNYVQKLEPTDKHNIRQSFIYYPLSLKNNKKGIITVQSFKKNAYENYDVQILKNLAVYVSTALSNAEVMSKIEQQKEEIVSQNDRLEEHKQQILKQNDHIKSAIRYAHTIQTAFLPGKEELDKVFSNFVIYRPKDIVSGDFYWHTKLFDKVSQTRYHYFAVTDCTGHGVPGAFVSLIGMNLLNDIIEIHKRKDPAEILECMDMHVRRVLKQKQTGNRDGMDICLSRISEKQDSTFELAFAGAKRPLFYYSNKNRKLNSMKGSRRTIGGAETRNKVKFQTHKTILNKGDQLYLTSDGMIDQHNKKRKRFGTRAFQVLLSEIAEFEHEKQQILIESALERYMGNELQRDDITVFGLRL